MVHGGTRSFGTVQYRGGLGTGVALDRCIGRSYPDEASIEAILGYEKSIGYSPRGATKPASGSFAIK